ncbi:hypothetical protein CFC21_082080 [Triticum aestivum]|uniref:F-box domain-containing protein n=2 Tax=Triticum aestivum TaxID=4565 RepID=A0A9R1I5R2_WHEAT|nr:hypothetical protein CFC21_082080 [Triticum aestivum]
MPPGSEDESAPLSATDRIGALPDHILHHLLSYLPAQAAARTCVLAWRWRHLWKSTTGLRIVGLDDEETVQVQDLRKFMDHCHAFLQFGGQRVAGSRLPDKWTGERR